MNIQTTIYKCRFYFICLLIALICCTLFLFNNGKAGCFLLLNFYHTEWLDIFFIRYTYVGDGLFAIGFILLSYVFVKKKKQGFALLLSFIISGLAAQIVKNIFNSPRPKVFFEAGQYLHFIDGVSLSN